MQPWQIILIMLGAAAGVVILGGIVIAAIKRKAKQYLGADGIRDIKDALGNNGLQDETTPKSLSGGDSLFIDSILRDFPDFNLDMAKKYVRDRLQETLGGMEDYRFHRCIINNYIRSSIDKTILFQAAVQYRVDSVLRQKRYMLHYSYTVDNSAEGDTSVKVAGVCPNCGAPLGSSDARVCSYCNSRLTDVMGNTWKFTEVYEIK